MLNPKDGYTQAPNWAIERLYREAGLCGFKVGMFLIRQLCGYHREFVVTTHLNIAQQTNISRRHVIRGLAECERLGIIRRSQDGNATRFELNLDNGLELNQSIIMEKPDLAPKSVLKTPDYQELFCIQGSDQSVTTERVELRDRVVTNSSLPVVTGSSLPRTTITGANNSLSGVYKSPRKRLKKEDKERVLSTNVESCVEGTAEGSLSPRMPKPKSESKVSPEERQTLIADWMTCYEANFGERYSFSGSLDGKSVNDLLGLAGCADAVLQRATKAWTAIHQHGSKAFACKKGRSLRGLALNWNEIAAELRDLENPRAKFSAPRRPEPSQQAKEIGDEIMARSKR